MDKDLCNKEYLEKIIGFAGEAYVWAEEEVFVFAKHTINELVEQNRKYHLSVQLEKLSQAIREKIEMYLLTYKREELIIVLTMLKGVFRTGISSGDSCNFEMAGRHKEVLILLHILLNPHSDKKGDKSLIDGCKNLAVSFSLVKEYSVFIDNLNHYSQCQGTESIDIGTFFKPGRFYSNEYNSYMDSFFEVQNVTNPEDIIINSPEINNILSCNKLSKDDIIDNLSKSVETIFNFSIEDLRQFAIYGLNVDSMNKYVVIRREDYYELLKDRLDNGRDAFNSIIETFSTKNCRSKEMCEEALFDLELKSIVEFENYIIFIPLEMVYNMDCFKKLMMKNHFSEYYSNHISDIRRIELKKQFDKYEEDITTFLSYVIMDKLLEKGYVFPEKNGQKIVEVSSIVVDGKTNILRQTRNYGDIDVFAINYEKKEILNLEIKHYKPIMHLGKLNSQTDFKNRVEHVKKVKERELVLKENISNVLKFFRCDLTGEDFMIRSILLTIRPDYWFINNNFNIEYYSLVDFFSEFGISDVE